MRLNQSVLNTMKIKTTKRPRVSHESPKTNDTIGSSQTNRKHKVSKPNVTDASPSIKECYIPLTDLYYTGTGDVYDKIQKQSNQLRNLESSVADLIPLKILLNPDQNHSNYQALSCERIINIIASEVFERIDRSNNVILFNIPENIQINTIKDLLMRFLNIPAEACYCTRLRKKIDA